jgi:tetratricopeptide (TPR) repeat protein
MTSRTKPDIESASADEPGVKIKITTKDKKKLTDDAHQQQASRSNPIMASPFLKRRINPEETGRSIQRVIELNLTNEIQDSEVDQVIGVDSLRDEIQRLTSSGRDLEAANVCIKLGKEFMRIVQFDDALEIYNTAMRLRHPHLGESHPDTAHAEVCIAEALEKKGEYFKAIQYYSRALGIFEQTLGASHPDAFNTAIKIAAIQCHQSDYYDRALDCYEKALVIKMEMLGPDHLSTAMTINNIAMVYKNKGDFTRAIEYFTRALTIKRKSLGDLNPETAAAVCNVGDMHRLDGDLPKALQYYLWALDIRKETLGERDRITIDTMYNLAILYKRAEMYADSARFFERSSQLLAEVLGSSHPEVLEASKQGIRAKALIKK